jgi:polyisoprenoid-binding protein YceI
MTTGRLLLLLHLLLLPGLVRAQSWSYQSGKVSFIIRNAGLKVEGEFAEPKAMVDFPESQPEKARIHGFVDVSGIKTGIDMRDRHLKGKEYFDAAAHPQISMNLQKLEKSGNKLSGLFQVRMKGREKEIRIPVQFLKTSETSAALQCSFTLNRLDFGIGSSSWTLSDEVTVRIDFLLKPSDKKEK